MDSQSVCWHESENIDNPDTPFLCHYCHNNKQNLVIEDLKQQVTLLESVLSTLRSKLPSEAPVLKTNSKPPSGTCAQVATSINPHIASSPQLNPNSNSHQYPKHEKHEKKYNIVVCGIKESVKGSSSSSCCKHDFQAISDVIRNVDNSVPETSARDCTRLGKYHEAKSRPILVKLTRTSDVQSILANRAKLANMPGTSIKPDMTKEQRKTEFMKERSSSKMVLMKKLSNYEEIVSTCKVKSTDQLQTLYTRPKCFPLRPPATPLTLNLTHNDYPQHCRTLIM